MNCLRQSLTKLALLLNPSVFVSVFAESLSYQETVALMDKCASKNSVMALSITASTLLVIYICTVAYFVAQRKVKSIT